MSDATVKACLYAFLIWCVVIIDAALWIDGGHKQPACKAGSVDALFTNCQVARR